jgi:hypothetical protein
VSKRVYVVWTKKLQQQVAIRSFHLENDAFVGRDATIVEGTRIGWNARVGRLASIDSAVKKIPPGVKIPPDHSVNQIIAFGDFKKFWWTLFENWGSFYLFFGCETMRIEKWKYLHNGLARYHIGGKPAKWRAYAAETRRICALVPAEAETTT